MQVDPNDHRLRLRQGVWNRGYLKPFVVCNYSTAERQDLLRFNSLCFFLSVQAGSFGVSDLGIWGRSTVRGFSVDALFNAYSSQIAQFLVHRCRAAHPSILFGGGLKAGCRGLRGVLFSMVRC